MIAHRMALQQYPFVQFGISGHVFADAEKAGFCPYFLSVSSTKGVATGCGPSSKLKV